MARLGTSMIMVVNYWVVFARLWQSLWGTERLLGERSKQHDDAYNYALGVGGMNGVRNWGRGHMHIYSS